jgi:hypothetical protein
MRNNIQNFSGKSEEKRQLEKLWRSYENNIKMDVEEVCKIVEWIQLSNKGVKCGPL